MAYEIKNYIFYHIIDFYEEPAQPDQAETFFDGLCLSVSEGTNLKF